jgi:hypothetical protein
VPVAPGALTWFVLAWSLVLAIAALVEGRLLGIVVGLALVIVNGVRLTSPGLAR